MQKSPLFMCRWSPLHYAPLHRTRLKNFAKPQCTRPTRWSSVSTPDGRRRRNRRRRHRRLHGRRPWPLPPPIKALLKQKLQLLLHGVQLGPLNNLWNYRVGMYVHLLSHFYLAINPTLLNSVLSITGTGFFPPQLWNPWNHPLETIHRYRLMGAEIPLPPYTTQVQKM